MPPFPDLPDRAAWRTENLEDPELAAAYAVENETIELDNGSLGVAWVFAILPASLVLALLSALLGNWVWDLVPVLVGAFVASLVGLKLGLFRRYASDLPIRLPNGQSYSGSTKRALLLKAGALAVLFTGLYMSAPLWVVGVRWILERL